MREPRKHDSFLRLTLVMVWVCRPSKWSRPRSLNTGGCSWSCPASSEVKQILISSLNHIENLNIVVLCSEVNKYLLLEWQSSPLSKSDLIICATMANLLVLTTRKVEGLDFQSRPAATGAIILLLLVSYISITRFMTWRRLSAFSGPFLASISYFPMLRIRRSGRSHLEYFELSKQYGSLVRIGPNDLLASSPDHLRRMSAARSTYQRSSWYKATRLDPYHDMMGSIMDKQAHMSLRSKVAAGYMGKDNPRLESDINSQVQSLVSLIKREYLSDESIKPVDFGRLADFYAHDSKSKLAFGKPLGLLETNKDVRGIIAIVKLALEWIQVFTDIPPLQKIFLSNTLLKLLGPKPTDSWGVGYLMGMARELVSSRLEPDAKDQQDLLVSRCYSHYTNDPKY